MKKVGAYDAKTHLPRLLERVRRGQRIAITKHGVTVAILVPPPESPPKDPRAVVEAIKAFRKGKKLGKLTLRELIETGRRF